MHEDDLVKPVYREDGSDADGAADPQATPGVRPVTGHEPEGTPFMLEVDGEMFAVCPGESGGTDYTWTTGRHHGYGFTMSPTAHLSLNDHLVSIRSFLAMVDSTTGYIGDDEG